MNIFICRLKVLLRDKATLFWTFIFPLGLALFFYMGFGTIDFYDSVSTTNVNVIAEEKYRVDDTMISVLTDLEYENGTKIFSLNYVDTVENAQEQFKNEKIDNYFYLDGEYKLISSNENVSTAISTVTTQYKNLENYIALKVQAGEAYSEELVNEFYRGTSQSFIESNATVDNAHFATIYFYALVSMICLFAAQFGIRLVMDVRADNSDIGIRAGVTPTSRGKLLGIYFIVAFLFEMVSTTLLVLFIKYILRIEFGNTFLVLIATWIGNIVGITFGMMVASLIKGSRGMKENIINGIALLSCFFAGLMSFPIKHMLDTTLGIFAKLNPATPIADSFFSLYFYDGYKNYLIDLGFMGLLSAIFFGIVLFKMRGEKYESL